MIWFESSLQCIATAYNKSFDDIKGCQGMLLCWIGKKFLCLVDSKNWMNSNSNQVPLQDKFVGLIQRDCFDLNHQACCVWRLETIFWWHGKLTLRVPPARERSSNKKNSEEVLTTWRSPWIKLKKRRGKKYFFSFFFSLLSPAGPFTTYISLLNKSDKLLNFSPNLSLIFCGINVNSWSIVPP